MRKRLLAIDEDIATLDIINDHAYDLGLDVYCSMGQLSLWQIQAVAPNVILIDYHLNGLNGHDLCADLKCGIRTKKIIVVIMWHARDYERSSKKVYADAHLSKPLDQNMLIRLLQQFN